MKIRVLHVDDEQDQLQLAKLLLKRLEPSLKVVSTSSPKDAQRMLHEQDFDCIVSDYKMPAMDGIELARVIRETNNIPFIIYTGRGSEEVAEAAFAAGIDDYVRKELDPSHYQVLAKRIRQAVEKNRVENALIESEKKYKSLVQDSRDGILVFTGNELVFANRQAAAIHGYNSVEEFMKIEPTTYLHPEDKDYVEERSLARQRGEKVPPLTDFRLILPDGAVRFVQSSSSLIQYNSKNSTLAFIRDITEYKQHEERLEALHVHAIELGEAESIEEVAESTLNAIEKVLGFDIGGFAVVEGNVLRFIHLMGVEMSEIFELPLDGPGITVRAVRTGETQLIPDIREVEDYVARTEDQDRLSELAVPVKIEDEVVAVINIESTRLNAFTDHDRRLLEIFSEHISSAMSRLKHVELLRASEERYKTLLEASRDAVSVIAGLKIVYVNQSYVELLCLRDPSEAIGRNALDFTAIEDREMIRRVTMGRQRGEEHPTRYEFKMLRADGAHIDVETQTSLIEYEGKPAALSFIRDITERKKAEEELIRLSNAVKRSTDSIVISNLDGRIIYVNEATLKMYGTESREDLIGRYSLDLIASEDRETALEGMKEAHEKGYVIGQEYLVVTKDGSKILVEMNSAIIRGMNGKPLGFVGISRDITDRKRMERELQRSEERWRSLVELAPDGIITLNLKGIITSVNTAGVRISGYGKDEFIGKHFSKMGFFRARDIPKYIKMFSSILRGKIPPPLEVPYTHNDGTTRWVEAHFSLLKAGSEKIGIQAILRDITERKQAEQKLQEYTSHLEEMVEEKTLELLDAERMAAAGRVAAMVGHDLRGPLQTISNAIYLLKKSPDISDDTLNMVEDAVKRATKMLEEFRHQTRDSPIKTTTVNLETLIKTAIEEASKPSSLDVALELGEGLEMVSVDPIKMQRVLDNLIRNAVEAMPDGGDLVITAERTGEKITIKVSDTGVGIPEGEMPNLFNPFHTTKPLGLGLGLAYCKRAVEAHGGIIIAESKVGGGATFTITLPIEGP